MRLLPGFAAALPLPRHHVDRWGPEAFDALGDKAPPTRTSQVEKLVRHVPVNSFEGPNRTSQGGTSVGRSGAAR